jgi:hypothetical protein
VALADAQLTTGVLDSTPMWANVAVPTPDGRTILAAGTNDLVDLWRLDGGAPPTRRGLPGPELLPARVGTDFGAVQATHQNLNDGTLEGLAFLDVPAFGVQFHPEAAPGPRDATGLFDRFIDLMESG